MSGKRNSTNGINSGKTESLLVLFDFSEASYAGLKYSMALAKGTPKVIHLFHVAQGLFAESENQLIAHRSIDEGSSKIIAKLKSLVEIIEEEGLKAVYDYSFGNEIEEVTKQISLIKPQLTLMGRRSRRSASKGKLTSFLINRYSGCVLVAGDKLFFNSNTKMGLACNKDSLSAYDLRFMYSLHQMVSPSLSLINILKETKRENVRQTEGPAEQFKEGEVNLRFENPMDINSADGLIEHVLREGVELLCIGRNKGSSRFVNRYFGTGINFLDITQRIDVPILILGNKK
jgi:hypothetical protein